jgi:hypothetical protein
MSKVFDPTYKFNELNGKQLKKLNKGMSFYKFTNTKFKLGNYVDHRQFDPIGQTPNMFDPYITERDNGGIYLTTLEHISKFQNLGCYYCELDIPDDAMCYIDDDTIKTNKFTVLSITYIDKEDSELIDNGKHVCETQN